MITDEKFAIERVLTMVLEHRVTSASGRKIPINADSVCVHGDGEKAFVFAKSLRKALEESGINVCAFGTP